jgi:hypothetical protein
MLLNLTDFAMAGTTGVATESLPPQAVRSKLPEPATVKGIKGTLAKS